MQDTGRFRLRNPLRGALAVALAAICALKLALAVASAQADDMSPAQSYGFAVLFPVGLAAALVGMGPTRSAEGLLMRLACIIQLAAIALAPPRVAAQLALGLPVAFLIVEFWERRAPSIWRETIRRCALQETRE